MGRYIWRSQNSFAGGIISEKMFGRVELEQYQDSVSQMINNKVLPHGGFARRSGTKFGWECKTTGITRVIPFEYSADDSYVLEFGAGYIRFGKNGVLIESAPGVPLELVTNYLADEIMQLKFVQSADVMWIVHRNHRPVKLLRYSDTEWYLDPVVFLDGPYFPVNVTAITMVASAATGSVTVTSSVAMTGPGANIPVFTAQDVGRLIRIWNATPAKWAWGEITAYLTAATVTVTVIENEFPIVATKLWKMGKFSTRTGWTGAVMLYEQRIAFAASPQALQDVDFSQTDNFASFQSAADETLLASDALSWSLFSQSVDNIAWMQPGRGGLAIGTSGGCWIMTGAGGKDDPLTPNSVNAKKHEAIGVEQYVQPISIDNAVVFVDKAGKRLHEFAYLWEDDTYRAPDLTILCDHLMRVYRVTDMDVQKTTKVIWLTLEDGRLIGLTYMRAESVVAWHEHNTAGTFQSVCAVTEGRDEIPYFVVKRTINGVAKQFIEYMETDFDGADIKNCYFLDCGLVAALSPAALVVGGLDHLNGEKVYALVDGKVVKNLTVTGGEITLPYSGETVQVGLNFVSDVETLPIEQTNNEYGSTVGRVKDLGKVALRVTESYGAKIGRTFDTLEEIKFNENLTFGATPELFSGERIKDKIEGQPATDVRICIRQDIPLPLTVNSLVSHYEVTED